MKNTANKVWAMVKNIRVTVTGKIKLGFIEIAVAPLNTCRLVRACFFFVMFLNPIYYIQPASFSTLVKLRSKLEKTE